MSLGSKIGPDLQIFFKCLLNPGKKRGYYLGWLGHSNLGDEALKVAVYELFKDSAVMQDHKDGFILRTCRKLGLFRIDFLMLGGGTLINKHPDWLIEIGTWWAKKNIVFGTGASDPIFWKTIETFVDKKDDWAKTLNKFDYIGVRGFLSDELLKEWGVKQKVNVIGDPVLFFTRPLVSRKPRKKLGLNFALPKRDLFWGRDRQKWMNDFTSFVGLMIEDGWEIQFIPVWEEDVRDAKKIEVHFKSPKIKVFLNYESVEETLDLMEKQDVFLGIKLHSVILSYCANTPGIMVEYRPKCRDFMNSIGMDELNIRIVRFNPQEAKMMVERVYENLETFRARGNKVCLGYKDELIKQAKIVSELVRK